MRKDIVAVALLLLLALVAYQQRGSIAESMLARGAKTMLATDATAELEDGLHIALCGAGGPLPDPQRSGPCVAVVAGDKLFVVDAGTNGARNLARMRYPMGRVEALLLTHFHSDHIDGMGELALQRWVNGNHTTPLPVIAPEGVEDIVEGFNRAYARDAVYRNEHHGDTVAPLSGKGMLAQPFPKPADEETLTIYEEDGVKIEALGVDHSPVSPAVGYLFSYGGRSALISGDTAVAASVQKFAKGVDLLVHEALAAHLISIMEEAAREAGLPQLERILQDIPDYHATPVEAAQIARDADVGHLLYYHIVPPLLLPGSEAAWLRGVDEVFGRYTLGRDGTSVSLPANSKKIEISEAL